LIGDKLSLFPASIAGDDSLNEIYFDSETIGIVGPEPLFVATPGSDPCVDSDKAFIFGTTFAPFASLNQSS
jgi:hypothetical protein